MVYHINSVHPIAFVFLIATCFLQSLCQVERPTDAVNNKEINNSDETKSTMSNNGIAPGDGLGKLSGKTDEKVDSLSGTLEENNAGIKKNDDGKTKEVKDGAVKEDEKKVDINEVKEQDEEKSGENEEEKKEDENVEEAGKDLKVLDDNNFEHLTQAATGATTGDWLVLFSKKDNCDECTQAEKEMKIVYARLQHKLNVAKVVQDSSSKRTFKRFDIDKKFPIIYLFHHGKMFSYERNISVDDFIKFLEGGYELAPWSSVREPYSPFEYYADECYEELKYMLRYRKHVSLLIFLAGLVCGVSLTSLSGSVLFHLLENFKDDEEECPPEQEPSRDVAKNKAE